jgi:hypothetical protein
MRSSATLVRGTVFRQKTGLYYQLALAVTLLLPAAAAGQGTEIVRGRVTGVDKKPIADVTVTITGLSTQAVLTARTTDKGIFTALFPNAEGDYLISFRKIGFSPYNTRLTRTGLTSVLVSDATLKELVFELDTITVAAQRLRPKGDEASVGGVEQNLLTGALFSLDPTDLLALAGQIPGILSLGDSGFSVLGAGVNANNGTVDGAKFGGRNVPQDAIAGSRVISTSADPSIGGFSGGQTATILKGGSDIFAMTTRVNFADSHLAWTDPDWPNPIPQIAGNSGGLGGPIIKKKLHYQFSWNINDRQADVYSLLDPPQSIISQYGFTRDTIDAISNTLNGLGVPLTLGNVPTNQHNQNYNTTTVLDWTPKATTQLRVTHNGFWGHNGSPGQAPFSYPSLGSRNVNEFQFVSARLTGYIHGFLDELNSTLNYSHFTNDPYAELPSANVRVGTIFDNGQTGLGSIGFGGGSGVNLSTSHDWDTRNEFSWIPSNSKHRIKIGQDIDYSWNTNFSAGNQFGSYSYQTLADLEANRPASYSRTLTSFERSSDGFTGALWVGDEWNATKALQFQGGLRYDAAFPGTTPDYNPAVDQAFGLKTDLIPHSRLVTPRLGFSWASAKRRGMGSPTGQGGPINLGNLPAGLSPEFIQALLGTPRNSTAPGFAITGSIGAYGSPLDNSNIAGLIDQTGLPNTRRVLTCVGDATPIPNWNSIDGNAPESCLDGTGPGTFSTNVPSVQVYDPAFSTPLVWRANLGIDGIRIPEKWTLALTGFYSYGLNRQSALDLNLNRAVQFNLADEANRPVFVTPGAIIPSTGVVAPGAYRINQNYGAVQDIISDLHNYTAQLQATMAPPHPLLHNKLTLSTTYVLNRTRTEQRGLGGGGGGFGNFRVISFGGGGFSNFGFGGGGSYAINGDPFTKAWVSGNQPTHQIRTNASFRAWWFNVNMQLNVYSGTPFTPSVSGDLNGDGLSDDLAFIPNPATTRDTALATQMRQLLASAPAGARDCLQKQLGTIAGVNSCTTQWQARLDFNINWQPPRSFGFGDRLRITTTMQNTSGALVRLFGLENTPLGRGALSTSANSQLLYVTGFDPATQSYRYQVNQLFGQPTNFGTARHRYPPFQMQLGLEYKLGGPPTAPMALSMGLLPSGKQPPYTGDQIRDKLSRMTRDPIQQILVRKDTMALSKEQVTQLEAISHEFRARSDSAMEPVFDYVMRKGRKIDDSQLSSRLGKAQPVIQRMLADANTRAHALLTPAQIRMLPVTPTLPGMNRATPPKADAPGGAGVRMIKPGF